MNATQVITLRRMLADAGVEVLVDPPRNGVSQCLLTYGNQAMEFLSPADIHPQNALTHLLCEVRMVYFECTRQWEKWEHWPHTLPRDEQPLTLEQRHAKSVQWFDSYERWGQDLKAVLGPLYWDVMRLLAPQNS